MAVHRIGNTLLVDKAEMAYEPSDFEWKEGMRNPPKKRSQSQVSHQAMYSKFLYYSIDPEEVSPGQDTFPSRFFL